MSILDELAEQGHIPRRPPTAVRLVSHAHYVAYHAERRRIGEHARFGEHPAVLRAMTNQLHAWVAALPSPESWGHGVPYRPTETTPAIESEAAE